MSDLEFDRDLLLQAFADQSEEGLTAMEEALIRLESQPADPETLNTIFRVCHTLKGDSASLGFEELESQQPASSCPRSS